MYILKRKIWKSQVGYPQEDEQEGCSQDPQEEEDGCRRFWIVQTRGRDPQDLTTPQYH